MRQVCFLGLFTALLLSHLPLRAQAHQVSMPVYRFNGDDRPDCSAGPLERARSDVRWTSRLVSSDDAGQLVYHPDEDGYVLPDFSYAGYRNGEQSIPEVKVVRVVEPIDGDNTRHLQEAIDSVGALPLGVDGFRGALLLKKGLYSVSGPLRVNHKGVVLRGEGNGPDPLHNTVVFDTQRDRSGGAAWRSVLLLGAVTKDNWEDNKQDEEAILDEIVPVGAREIRIARNENYKEGDDIVIHHPCTDAWLEAVNYGDVGDKPVRIKDWTNDTAPIYYRRKVTRVVHHNSVTVLEFDAPVFYSLQKSLSQSVVYRYRPTALQNIGLENLRVDCSSAAIPDEQHAWNAIGFVNVENAWALDVAAVHFAQAGFFTERATQLTFERCLAMDPVARVWGGRMYNFNLAERSQLILFKDCYARGGRHNFVSNGTSTVSGCVIYRCKSEGSRTTSEGHRIWSQGLLFDSYEDFNPLSDKEWMAVLGFYNRWNMGSGHGWAMVHGVLWNCNLRTDHSSASAKQNSPVRTRSAIYCEQPPTAQNYVIGCWLESVNDVRSYKHESGYVEGTNRAGLFPASLYEAQLKDRMRN